MKPRVIIRPVESSDQKPFVAASLASAGLHGRWVTAPGNAREFKQYLGRLDGKGNHGFVVCMAGTGEIVGAVNLTNIVLGSFCSGYLGYYAFAGHQGQGLMKQGLRAVVRHAFTDLKLHRLEANIQPANTASIALVRGCGFHLEGYSPAYLKIFGRWRDHERWALVRV